MNLNCFSISFRIAWNYICNIFLLFVGEFGIVGSLSTFWVLGCSCRQCTTVGFGKRSNAGFGKRSKAGFGKRSNSAVAVLHGCREERDSGIQAPVLQSELLVQELVCLSPALCVSHSHMDMVPLLLHGMQTGTSKNPQHTTQKSRPTC